MAGWICSLPWTEAVLAAVDLFLAGFTAGFVSGFADGFVSVARPSSTSELIPIANKLRDCRCAGGIAATYVSPGTAAKY